ncbi:hypothetical protein Taro_016162 [Colocasia esculenta]|uniref:Uncharacterized protein n=1 Tax=Colocasia esculenta TaxID=4460 RepID=A0A843UJK5_COLES|nr:hypothetical protein [Colocasia esculenta]
MLKTPGFMLVDILVDVEAIEACCRNTFNDTTELLPFGRLKRRKSASHHHPLSRLHHRRDLHSSLGIDAINVLYR